MDVKTLTNVHSTLHKELIEFSREKLLYIDPATFTNTLFKVFAIIKSESKVTRCPKCKLFKNAGAQCRNQDCTRFMEYVECEHCKKRFVKLGHHKCKEKRVSSTNKTLNDTTQSFLDLESNKIQFELLDY